MKMLLNSKMFFLIGSLLVTMLNGKKLPDINNDAKAIIADDYSNEKYSANFARSGEVNCDNIASFGMRSIDSTDDNNEYFLELNTPIGCRRIFSGISASGQDFVNIISNITIAVQKGQFNGTGTATNSSFTNPVWQELPSYVFIGDPMSAPPGTFCYGFRIRSKYPYNYSEFLQKLKDVYYPVIDNYKISKDQCEKIQLRVIIGGSFLGVSVICWCAGIILICRDVNARLHAENLINSIPSTIYSFLGSHPNRRRAFTGIYQIIDEASENHDRNSRGSIALESV